MLVTENSKVTDSNQDPGQSLSHEPNFLVKHWRGGYSLGFSCWVIVVLLTATLVAIIKAIQSSNFWCELGARASGAAILVFYSFVVTLTLWQLIGLWRSACNHRQRGGKAFWAGLAKVIVVLGLLRAAGDFSVLGIPIIFEGVKLYLGVDNIQPLQIRLLHDGTELELSGGMPFGTTNAVKEFLDAAPTVQIIHMNSRGGRMNEAYQLYKTIKERNLSTYTSADCVSACSLAFLAGRERYLGESGRLGFHSTSSSIFSGEIAKEFNGNDGVRQILQTHGVPNSFIDRALSTSPKNMWYPSKDELLEAKVIDSVVDSRSFGVSSVNQWRDACKTEGEVKGEFHPKR
jgi:hypothetical protein